MPSALFIGGTGLISSQCVAQTLARGWEVTLLNRGNRPPSPGTKSLTADFHQPDQVRAAFGQQHFDAIINFIAYSPLDVQRDIDLFAGRTRQYVLISTRACYQKPPAHYIVNEKTPLENPYWPYAQAKIACEQLAMQAHRAGAFPVTIIRPSLTYGISRIPAAYHNSTHSWTTAHRFLTGQPVIALGDGTSLWQITHAADFARGFVGLLAHPSALGQDFNITTDEVLNWNTILSTQASILGVTPHLIHIPSDFIARFDPVRAEGLYGDKTHSIVVDNSKLKSVVPDYRPSISLVEGLTQTIAWFRQDPARQTIDPVYNATADKIITAYQRAWV